MVKARQTLECMVRCMAEKACLVEGDLSDTIDQLYEGGWINKTTKDNYHTIRILGNKAVHENDNTAYNANQAYQLLTKQVYAFSHDFQVSKTFNVPVTETRPVRNTRTGAAAGSSGTGSTSYGRTDGTRPRTGTGAGNGPRSGAELQGVLIVPEQGEAVTEQEVIQIQAAEGEIPKVPGAPMAVLPEAEGPAEENTDHHLWKWY